MLAACYSTFKTNEEVRGIYVQTSDQAQMLTTELKANKVQCGNGLSLPPKLNDRRLNWMPEMQVVANECASPSI